MPFIIFSRIDPEKFSNFIKESRKTKDGEEMTEMPQGKLVECKYCKCTGKVYEANHVGILDIGSQAKPCPVCHGTGYQRV
jgi:DnaJ-class molecular chaperone